MELSIAESLNEKILRYKTEWRLHVDKMDATRFARRALDDYHPRGKKSVGRPRKRRLRLEPVSYTHLDVYKRQVCVCVIISM